jgi:uncharacterized protein YukE
MSHMGGDLEELAALRVTLANQSQAIEQVATAVRTQLDNTTWHGSAAERFRGAWTSEFEPSLRRLQAALEEAGLEVGRRRDALLAAGG